MDKYISIDIMGNVALIPMAKSPLKLGQGIPKTLWPIDSIRLRGSLSTLVGAMSFPGPITTHCELNLVVEETAMWMKTQKCISKSRLPIVGNFLKPMLRLKLWGHFKRHALFEIVWPSNYQIARFRVCVILSWTMKLPPTKFISYSIESESWRADPFQSLVRFDRNACTLQINTGLVLVYHKSNVTHGLFLDKVAWMSDNNSLRPFFSRHQNPTLITGHV